MTRLQRGKIEPWISSILAPEVCFSEEPAQVGVSLRGLDEEREVCTIEQRDFSTSDRLYPHVLCRLGKDHRSVEPVVIRERESGVAQLLSLKHELLWE